MVFIISSCLADGFVKHGWFSAGDWERSWRAAWKTSPEGSSSWHSPGFCPSFHEKDFWSKSSDLVGGICGTRAAPPARGKIFHLKIPTSQSSRSQDESRTHSSQRIELLNGSNVSKQQIYLNCPPPIGEQLGWEQPAPAPPTSAPPTALPPRTAVTRAATAAFLFSLDFERR